MLGLVETEAAAAWEVDVCDGAQALCVQYIMFALFFQSLFLLA
jgi:hypothetical protein